MVYAMQHPTPSQKSNAQSNFHTHVCPLYVVILKVKIHIVETPTAPSDYVCSYTMTIWKFVPF